MDEKLSLNGGGFFVKDVKDKGLKRSVCCRWQYSVAGKLEVCNRLSYQYLEGLKQCTEGFYKNLS